MRKHLEECTREWAETVTESSNLEEEEKKAVEEEQKVMEEVKLFLLSFKIGLPGKLIS